MGLSSLIGSVFPAKSRSQLLLIQGHQLAKRVNSPLVENLYDLAKLGAPIFRFSGGLLGTHSLNKASFMYMFK